MARQSAMVAAREAVVVNVGASPIVYGEIDVRHNKTGEAVTITNHNEITDEGDEGVPYAFKAGEKVRRDHPAVKAAPGAFVEVSEVEDLA